MYDMPDVSDVEIKILGATAQPLGSEVEILGVVAQPLVWQRAVADQKGSLRVPSAHTVAA